MAMITAVGNDVGFAHVYTRQVLAHGASRRLPGRHLDQRQFRQPAGGLRQGRARWARPRIGLAGGDGGRMREPGRATTAWWCPPTASTACRRCHVALYHILWDLMHTLLADDRGPAGGGGMKYVDEFRDRDKARSLVVEIDALADALAADAPRPLQIMEVCGGHTHSIFRYGLKDLLPPSIEFVHGPAARSACCRWGAWTIAWRSPNTRR